jgi:hypothetical protein
MASQPKTLRTLRIVGLLILACALGWTGSARAQLLQNLYPGFFEPANPQVLDAILFGGGFGSQDYGAVQEGLQLQQTVTPYFGVVGRITGYQLWIGDHFNNPLAPATFTYKPRLNFARLQAGGQFALYPGQHSPCSVAAMSATATQPQLKEISRAGSSPIPIIR